MKRVTDLKSLILILSICASWAGCSKSINTQSAPANIRQTTLSRAAIGQSSFNLWATCNGHPYLITGSNGICIPLGNCSSDNDAAQQSGGQNATGFQFYGCFKGGTAASSSASEEAVFMCDNVTQWNGDEMGFVKTLSDNALKAYVQGGGQYLTRVISLNDNGYHTFKAQASSNNTQVDFYIDGAYNCSLTNNSGHYFNNWYYMVGTNHWYGGSDNSGQQIEMYNMVTY